MQSVSKGAQEGTNRQRAMADVESLKTSGFGDLQIEKATRKEGGAPKYTWGLRDGAHLTQWFTLNIQHMPSLIALNSPRNESTRLLKIPVTIPHSFSSAILLLIQAVPRAQIKAHQPQRKHVSDSSCNAFLSLQPPVS